jgi:hypothetical protein
MNSETEGKILVTLIISLIAFGCGSGAGIVLGISQNDSLSPTKLNLSQQNVPQYPVTQKSVSIQNTQQQIQTENNLSNETYVESPQNSNQEYVNPPQNQTN